MVDAHQTGDVPHIANACTDQFIDFPLGETTVVPQKRFNALCEHDHRLEITTPQRPLARRRVPFSDGDEIFLNATSSKNSSLTEPVWDVPSDFVQSNPFQEVIDDFEEPGGARGVNRRVTRVTGGKGNIPADFTGKEDAATSQDTGGLAQHLRIVGYLFVE